MMGTVYAWLTVLTVLQVVQMLAQWQHGRKENSIVGAMEKREQMILDSMRRIDITEKMDLVLAAVQEVRMHRSRELDTSVRKLIEALKDQSTPFLHEKHWLAIREIERLLP